MEKETWEHHGWWWWPRELQVRAWALRHGQAFLQSYEVDVDVGSKMLKNLRRCLARLVKNTAALIYRGS